MSMFWTDVNQAIERLNGTIVNYDGSPTYIEEAYTSKKGQVVARAEFLRDNPNEDTKVVALDDEKWNNFRDLPKLGWFNYVRPASEEIIPIFLERRAVNSRSHGLNGNNVSVWGTTNQGVEKQRYGGALRGFFRNPGYLETSQSEEEYPKLTTILMSLGSSPSGAAFSSKFSVVVTEEGMKWLYRKTKRVGFFTGTDSLNLFPKHGFLKEELERCPTFDITNIKEF